MKVKIYTNPDKRPDFIARQLKSFQTFLKDDFELIVLNNGSTAELRSTIRYICSNLQITHHYVDAPNHSNPNIANAHSLSQMLERFIKKETEDYISVIIDSDMFLVREFSIYEYCKDYELAGLKQIRDFVKYIWNGLIFINHATIKDIKELSLYSTRVGTTITDEGGDMYYYFERHPHCKLRNILHTSHITSTNNNLGVLPTNLLEYYDDVYCFELLEGAFLHYGRGSNWNGMSQSYHKDKTTFLDTFLDKAHSGELQWSDYAFVFDYDCWTVK
jgi:hypothetical protein